MGQICQVTCCPYLADAAIGEFLVCQLHRGAQVRLIIEEGRQPAAYWCEGRPIVLSAGPLNPKTRENPGAIRVIDDPRMAEVDDTPTAMVLAHYDLTRR